MEKKFRFVFGYEKTKSVLGIRYRTLDELLDCSFAGEDMNEDILGGFSCDDDIEELDILAKEQYTGLKDKNGVEIYGGDVCRCWGGEEHNGMFEYSKTYEVKWQGSGFDMVIDDCGYGWNYSGHFENIEVIGNIHENPELINP